MLYRSTPRGWCAREDRGDQKVFRHGTGCGGQLLKVTQNPPGNSLVSIILPSSRPIKSTTYVWARRR